MERRVETGDLRQVGKPPMKRLGQQNFLRQMFGIKRTELVQLLDHCRRDPLRFPIFRAAMHHAVAHGRQRAACDLFLDPIHQDGTPPPCGPAPRWAAKSCRLRSNPLPRNCPAAGRCLRFARPESAAIRAGFKQRELDARRAAVDRQDARRRQFASGLGPAMPFGLCAFRVHVRTLPEISQATACRQV